MRAFHEQDKLSSKQSTHLQNKIKDFDEGQEKTISSYEVERLSQETIDALSHYRQEIVKKVPSPYIKQEVRRKIFQVLNIVGMVFSVWFLYRGFTSGFLTDPDQMQAFLDRAGYGAPIVFIFIQIIQVVIPIIPAAMTIPVGTIVFGFWYGFLLNFIGIMIGSVIIFLLARRLGRPFVQMVLDERSYNKYARWIESEQGFEKLFTYTMFIPLTPADFLCCFAGLTPISFKKFMVVLTLSKIPTLFIYQYGTTGLLNLFLNK